MASSDQSTATKPVEQVEDLVQSGETTSKDTVAAPDSRPAETQIQGSTTSRPTTDSDLQKKEVEHKQETKGDDNEEDDDSSSDSDDGFPEWNDGVPRGKHTGPVSGGGKPVRPVRPTRP
ncbi:hypothetical protein FA15DRAFT_703135 [Coprinopsis marcescibilis]|uniref:Uncharacterized protein n=1 Tax=Coprinopsis marcescibilis TaxID=230819 RepID=A0A5C3L1S5_COPMA|nr:hypothetical protein FA15DRAFT_703135 [Coprinopsis marcescibilis]